jgi:electron transfer flavoprotein beta subunit
MAECRVGVAMKWVALRPEIDVLDATIASDDRWSGASPADLAALELGLRIAQQRGGSLTAATVGDATSEPLLRQALECGATRALRIDPKLRGNQQPTSQEVARALAVAFVDCDLVICGDWSLDRGSASVPVFLAAALGVDDACGLVKVDINMHGSNDDALVVERRLDGGRRQRMSIPGRAVLSVEGSAARIRRASLAGVFAARSASIDVIEIDGLLTQQRGVRHDKTMPYRPPAPRYDSPPSSDPPLRRVADLMGVNTDRTPPTRLELDADSAAELIIERVNSFNKRA